MRLEWQKGRCSSDVFGRFRPPQPRSGGQGVGLVERTPPAASQEVDFPIRAFGCLILALVGPLVLIEAQNTRGGDRPPTYWFR